MYNYLIKIEYDGTNFAGWQCQKNAKTVQGEIEKSIKKILKQKTRIVGAGRTDKGVHAKGQYANFKVKTKISDTKKFLASLNHFLKKKLISIIFLKRKNINFHARFLANERIYKYKIINRESNLALEKNKAWHIKKKLDINLLKKGAKILKGKHDFSTFRASTCVSKSPVKTISFVKVTKNQDKIIITFKSKSFLQNQVRSMVGCLGHLAKKKWNLTNFKKILKSKNRSLCAPPAPACGLYLEDVKY